jgi:hypothetical protein
MFRYSEKGKRRNLVDNRLKPATNKGSTASPSKIFPRQVPKSARRVK